MNEAKESHAEIYKREFISYAWPFEKNFYDPQFLSALHNIYCDYLDSKFQIKKNDDEILLVSRIIEIHMAKLENRKISNLVNLRSNHWVNDDFLNELKNLNLNENQKNDIQDAVDFFTNLFVVRRIIKAWSEKKEEALDIQKLYIANEVANIYPSIEKRISNEFYGLVGILKKATDAEIRKIPELKPTNPTQVANFIAAHQQKHFKQNYNSLILTSDKVADANKKKQEQSLVLKQDTKSSLIKRILYYIKDNSIKLLVGFMLGAIIIIGIGFFWPALVPSIMVAIIGKIASLAIMGVLSGILSAGMTAVLHQIGLKYFSMFKSFSRPGKNDFKPESKKITNSISTKNLNHLLKVDKKNDNKALVNLTIFLYLELQLPFELKLINSLPAISLEKILTEAIQKQSHEKLAEIYLKLKTENGNKLRIFVGLLAEISSTTLLSKMYQILVKNDPSDANKFRDDVIIFLNSNDQSGKSTVFLKELSPPPITEKSSDLNTDAVNKEHIPASSKIIQSN